jgi:predicted unusual protein kinase regulating ubiquinone biosynthesis (AarF/ABC1/UbiB family)
MNDSRLLPPGRIGRIARLAAAGARLGAQRLRGGDETDSALHAVRVLGNLRGLATKVGQMASYVDGVLPAAQRDTYGAAMSALFRAAPASPPEAIRALVEDELGAPMDELFMHWSPDPIASASIGQVHRARLHDGTEVAVKVQHPGIRKALESDLANAGLLETLFGSYLGKGFNAAGVLAEARARFLEELDYALEARRQVQFAEIHHDDSRVRIPDVVLDRSSARVLTTHFVEGITLEEAALRAPQERRAWAETMWRFVFRGSLVGGLFNADPHPGNFFFHEDGAVSFIDFGCIQPFPRNQHPHALVAHAASIDRDEEAFRRAGTLMLDVQPGLHADLAVGFMRQCFEPLFASPFRMTSQYVSSLVEQLRDSALHARHLQGDEINPLPEGVLFLNRLQFGFYSVLARLDVDVDYAAIERPILEEARRLGLG